MSSASLTSNKIIAPFGRLPWYSSDGKVLQPYIIGISGGSASGKTSVSQKIIQELGGSSVALLSMDSFYNALTPSQIKDAHANMHNFDHPDSFDYELAYSTLKDLKNGIKVNVPCYDFATHSRLDKTVEMYGANVIVTQ